MCSFVVICVLFYKYFVLSFLIISNLFPNWCRIKNWFEFDKIEITVLTIRNMDNISSGIFKSMFY